VQSRRLRRRGNLLGSINFRTMSPTKTTFDAGDTNGNYFDAYVASVWK
jgi:hypothetical protein